MRSSIPLIADLMTGQQAASRQPQSASPADCSLNQLLAQIPMPETEVAAFLSSRSRLEEAR
jgi:hypothetical protein